MFRRKQDDDDPFAALKEANERGTTTLTSGSAAPPRASVGGEGAHGSAHGSTQGSGRSGDDGSAAFGAPAVRRARAPERHRNAPLVLLTIVVSLGAAGALVSLSGSPADQGSDGAYFSGPQRDEEDGGSRSGGGEGGGGGTASKRVDLVQAIGFGGALAEIEGRLRRGERVWLLRVARDRVNALTRLPNGDQRSIDVDDSFGTRVTDSGSAGSHRGIPLSRVSALAPSLATTLAARQARISPRKLDYLVMTTSIVPGGKADWQLFFRGVPQRDRHFAASLDGMTVRRPGASSTTTSTLRITTNGKTRTISGAQAQRITACIRRAGSDGARIQRCLP